MFQMITLSELQQISCHIMSVKCGAHITSLCLYVTRITSEVQWGKLSCVFIFCW